MRPKRSRSADVGDPRSEMLSGDAPRPPPRPAPGSPAGRAGPGVFHKAFYAKGLRTSVVQKLGREWSKDSDPCWKAVAGYFVQEAEMRLQWLVKACKPGKLSCKFARGARIWDGTWTLV